LLRIQFGACGIIVNIGADMAAIDLVWPLAAGVRAVF
jgi:hypothetical protein